MPTDSGRIPVAGVPRQVSAEDSLPSVAFTAAPHPRVPSRDGPGVRCSMSYSRSGASRTIGAP